jgi:BirA family biotin operon repressor/biotin-[acetyl-CoA-carboxylase] ligase
MRTLPDLAAEITSHLPTGRFGRPLHVYERVTSTNDVAKRLADQGASEGAAVLALEQTAGRGRLGRLWASPRGGMYLSVVLRPALASDRWSLLGIAVAVGSASAAESLARAPITLKWPNDLLLETRKVGGILVEAAPTFAVAGIGINAAVPPDLLPSDAASLNVELRPLVCEILRGVEHAVAMLPADAAGLLAQWRRRSATLGRHVTVVGREEVAGIAEDIDADGALLLRTAQGVRRVLAGDVSLR